MGDRPYVGGVVIFHDAKNVAHKALVTEVWDCGVPEDQQPCINLLYVSEDEKREDEYGRQIIRESSIVHKSNISAPGNYWRNESEVAFGATASE